MYNMLKKVGRNELVLIRDDHVVPKLIGENLNDLQGSLDGIYLLGVKNLVECCEETLT